MTLEDWFGLSVTVTVTVTMVTNFHRVVVVNANSEEGKRTRLIDVYPSSMTKPNRM